MATLTAHQGRLLATLLATAAAAYLVWKITQSPELALQFTFNGLSVGAVYALLAIGFTLVYSTVWFFDLYYGAAAALGAYGVFYLRSQQAVGGQYAVNSLAVNVVFGALVAGVVAWVFAEAVYPRLRDRYPPRALRALGGLLAAAAGVYTGVILAYPNELHLMLAPAAGLGAAALGDLDRLSRLPPHRPAHRPRRDPRLDPGRRRSPRRDPGRALRPACWRAPPAPTST